MFKDKNGKNQKKTALGSFEICDMIGFIYLVCQIVKYNKSLFLNKFHHVGEFLKFERRKPL